MDGPGHDQQVLGSQVVSGLRHDAGQFQTPLRSAGSLLVKRIGPKQKRADAADGDADLVRHAADAHGTLRAGFGREVVLQIVVQFDPIESRVFGKLQAFPQVHPVGIGEGPEVDRLLHVVTFGGRTAVVWLRLVCCYVLLGKAIAPPAAAKAELMAVRRVISGD